MIDLLLLHRLCLAFSWNFSGVYMRYRVRHLEHCLQKDYAKQER